MTNKLLLCSAFAAAAAGCFIAGSGSANAQSEPAIQTFATRDFSIAIDPISQTARALRPANSTDDFDFTPSDREKERARNGFYRLGDITLRYRTGGQDAWTDFSSAARHVPIKPISDVHALASADLSPALPMGSPIQIQRAWRSVSGNLVLRFTIKNISSKPVEIGALGIPMVFNNIISNRNLEQAHEACSFSDPYIGQDAGYLQVTRLTGTGPALLVVPDEGTKTPFEGYQLLQEPMYPNQTFEGMYAWMVHTKAYAEREWKQANPWNTPTSATLYPGQSRVYGVRFLLAPSIRKIDDTLAANHRPVAMGVPGYVLPMDLDARLFLKYSSQVKSITSDPPGSIAVKSNPTANSSWQPYTLKGVHWGRSKLTVTYADGLNQTISCYVIKPAAQAAADLGNFLFTKQWFEDPSDPFHRSPSIISYDREANKQVTQDSRVWISGLGDEGGSGSYLAAAMKLYLQPNAAELEKFERFVDGVLWGGIQYSDGPNKFGVRKSMFYYQPSELPNFEYDPKQNWTSWTSWSKRASEDIGRGFNYPHVAAAYWAMYRATRNNPGFHSRFGWKWYLDHAYETVRFLTDRGPNGNYRVGYVEMGLMEGDIFLAILNDMKHEGWGEKAAHIERNMRIRAEVWRNARFPFGSEMAWDSTGQEEVFAWCKHFGYEDKAEIALNSILGYMPGLPHWGYNGNARRYWDFLYGGKLSRIERQIHHYGSGINSLPLLLQYRQQPEDLYLLRVGYAGGMAALSNIDQEGFASAAFHSFESTLKWDAYSGDYGPNFFGHAMADGSYLVKHPELGWLSFGGNVKQVGGDVVMEPKDSSRNRVYIAPCGLWLTLDAGTFSSVTYSPKTGQITVALAPATKICTAARLRIEVQAKKKGLRFVPRGSYAQDAEAYSIPLNSTKATVTLMPVRI
jgi:Family of unknown function (DUF5695)